MYPSVAITSIGLVSPFAMSWEDLADCEIQPKGETSDLFDMNYHNTCEISKELLNIPSKESRIMGKHSLMLIKASEEAFIRANFNRHNPEDIGYYSSLGMVDYSNEDFIPAVVKSMSNGELDYELFFKKGYREIYPLWPLSMLNNIALCQSAIRLNIKGDNSVFTPHSDSSLHAINEAAYSISSNHCKVALAGGVSEVISPLSIARYILCNTNGSRKSKKNYTFHQPMTEGAVVFGIEDLDSPKKRFCKIKGFGSAFGFDNQKGGVTTKAITSSMNEALIKADLKKLDLVLTHYNTLYEESENEVKAIKTLLGEDMKYLSLKPLVGDMLSSAGTFDCAIAVCLLNGIIPNFLKNYLPQKEYNSILINSFSVEGNAASLILARD